MREQGEQTGQPRAVLSLWAIVLWSLLAVIGGAAVSEMIARMFEEW
jgi:hypothetical protein